MKNTKCLLIFGILTDSDLCGTHEWTHVIAHLMISLNLID